jgi:tetratricopeptide (TPR) repeat protein
MLSCCLILLIAMVMPVRAQAQTVPVSPGPIWHDDLRQAESGQADSTIDPALLEEYRLARLDYEAGLIGSATQRLEYVIGRDQTFARAFDNLGLCYEAQNEPKKALQFYREAVRLNRYAPKPSPWPPFNLGVLLHHGGSLIEAESLLKESIDYRLRTSRSDAPMPWHADMSRGYYQLGILLEHRRRFGEAYEALTLATREDPSYSEPQEELARIARVTRMSAKLADAMRR